jgi:hypothetical protein
VEVQSVQLIKSPKNFDLDLIHVLVLSKMEPHTKIDVIPYATKIHNNSADIKNVLLKYMKKN